MGENSCCACLPCIICRVLGHLCISRCARHCRRGTVCGSLIKKSELPVIFNQLSDKSTVRKISSRILSEAGNLAFVIALRVEWNDGTNDQYVLKTMDFGRSRVVLAFHPQRRELAPMIQPIMIGCHNAECAAYEFLRDQPGVKIPAIHFTLHASNAIAGMIIMENLTPRAKMEAFTRGLDLEQMLSVVEALARIHIASLKSESWRTGVADQVSAAPLFSMIFGGMGNLVLHVKVKRELQSIDVKKATEFFTSPKYLQTLYCHRGKLPDVLVHGDALPTNIMFELLPDGKVGTNVAAIIDWQLARAGNPFDDITKLLSWGAQLDVYEHHQDTILERYLSIMKAECPEHFQAPADVIKHVWTLTLAAHSAAVPVLVTLFLGLNQKKEMRYNKEQKAEAIRKSIFAYNYANENLFSVDPSFAEVSK